MTTTNGAEEAAIDGEEEAAIDGEAEAATDGVEAAIGGEISGEAMWLAVETS